jgi:transcriptional regulator GlxA family with amidase domain
VLVRFTPVGAAAFLPVPVGEFYHRSCSLEDVFPLDGLLRLADELSQLPNDRDRVDRVQVFLAAILRVEPADSLVTRAVELIRESGGTIRVAALGDVLGSSTSPLERRFQKIVGTSPKRYARLIRLEHVLKSGTSEPDMTRLALDSGYFDQAHFVHDFGRLTGKTPEAYFAGLRPLVQ